MAVPEPYPSNIHDLRIAETPPAELDATRGELERLRDDLRSGGLVDGSIYERLMSHLDAVDGFLYDVTRYYVGNPPQFTNSKSLEMIEILRRSLMAVHYDVDSFYIDRRGCLKYLRPDQWVRIKPHSWEIQYLYARAIDAVDKYLDWLRNEKRFDDIRRREMLNALVAYQVKLSGIVEAIST